MEISLKVIYEKSNFQTVSFEKKFVTMNWYIVCYRGPLGRMAISAKSVHLFKYCINK